MVGEMRLSQTDGADERAAGLQFDGHESMPILGNAIAHFICQLVALCRGEGRGQETHGSGVTIQCGKAGLTRVLPLSENESFRVNGRHYVRLVTETSAKTFSMNSVFTSR